MKYLLISTVTGAIEIRQDEGVLPPEGVALSDSDYADLVAGNKIYKGGVIQLAPPPAPAEVKAIANARIIANLAIIDLKSIRSIREWIAAQPTAPTFLKTQEAAAAQERAKLT